VARTQHTRDGDMVGSFARGNAQQSGSSFTHVSQRVMIARLLKRDALGSKQVERSFTP
jgi:hypothetical protein